MIAVPYFERTSFLKNKMLQQASKKLFEPMEECRAMTLLFSLETKLTTFDVDRNSCLRFCLYKFGNSGFCKSNFLKIYSISNVAALSCFDTKSFILQIGLASNTTLIFSIQSNAKSKCF